MQKGVIVNTFVCGFLALVCFTLSGLLYNHSNGLDDSMTGAVCFMGLGFYFVWIIIKVYREPNWDLFKGMKMDY